MEEIFFELSAIIIVSTALGLLARLLKQPIILAFIVTGIILGPFGLNWLQSHELIDVLATFGIAFLLFLIGVELDLNKFRKLNKIAVYAGLGQVIFTGSSGFILSYLLGFSLIQAWFIAVALTFSSTIIVVKLLTEKRQLDSLYGRITIAILIIQDFLAVLALLLLESFGANLQSTGVPWPTIGLTALKAIFIGGIAWFLAKYVFKKIFEFVGHSQELLFLWSIAWCLVFGALSIFLNFSIAIGVFFAGLAIAGLEYNYEIAARIRSLRDFFIVIFFSLLGSQLVLSMDVKLIISSLILGVFVLIGNPLIVYIMLRITHQQPRIAFFTGLTVGQVSEFSFIIANLGLKQGHLSQEIVSMIAIIGLFTMVISTYLITYNEQIYKLLQPILSRFPGKVKDKNIDDLPTRPKNHIVLLGYHPTVNKVLQDLKAHHKDIVVVDYNPANTKDIHEQDVYYIYGDVRDEDILDKANLDEAGMIISIVTYHETTMALLQYVKHFKIKAQVVVSARHPESAKLYYQMGATFVLHPESISLDYLKQLLDNKKLDYASKEHRKELKIIAQEGSSLF